MNLQSLFYIQKNLDDRIIEEHGLIREHLLSHKLLALLVELGELANETRCFKYWSKKAPSDKQTILEEYVDGLHFILSIGIDLEYTDVEWQRRTDDSVTTSHTEQFLTIYYMVSSFSRSTCTIENYAQLLLAFLSFGENLGFSLEEIEQSYLAKNEINHQRQNQGY